MIEQIKKQSVTNLDNLDVCCKNLEQMIVDLENGIQSQSSYLKVFKNNLNKLYAKMKNMNVILSTYDIILSKLVEVENIDDKIMTLKQELAQSQMPELIVNQIKELQEERMNLINQAKMLSYE